MATPVYNPGVPSAPLELEIPTGAPWAGEFTAWWTATTSAQRRGFFRHAAKVGMAAAWQEVAAPWEEFDLTLDDAPEETERTSALENQAELDALERVVDLATDLEDDREA